MGTVKRMTRRVLTFDMDGVIAAVEYVPVMERQITAYIGAPVLADRMVFNRICLDADVYVISSRSYRNATQHTKNWLYANDMPYVTGVICGILPRDKAALVHLLNASYHFDDHPKTTEECGKQGVLVRIIEHYKYEPRHAFLRTARNWGDIERLCRLPEPKISYHPEQGNLFRQ